VAGEADLHLISTWNCESTAPADSSGPSALTIAYVAVTL
jgi:hypothetical protein